MRPLILYHANCPDGAGAALAAYQKFGNGADYVAVSHGNEPPWDQIDNCIDDIYLVDFCYPRQVMIDISRRDIDPEAPLRTVFVLDHHKSAQEALIGIEEETSDRSEHDTIDVTFDMQYSGAVLAWRHFFPDRAVPDLLLYLEDRDLWKWALLSSKEINTALKSYGGLENFLSWEKFLQKFPQDQLTQEGQALLRADQQYVQQISRQAEIVSFDVPGDQPVCCWACNATTLFSEVAEAMVTTMSRPLDRDFTPMGIAWYWDGPGQRYRVSLRSRSDFDVSKIAKAFGGGGHLRASGFECKELPWRKTL